MHRTIRTLVADHRNFEVLLSVLDEQLERASSGNRLDLVVVEAIVSYLRRYGDLCHHPRENILYRLVAAKGVPGSERTRAIQREHRDLHLSTDAVLGEVRAALMRESSRPNRVLGPLRELMGSYRDHIRAEDSELIPLIQTHLDEADWRLAEAAVGELDLEDLEDHVHERFIALRDYIHVMHRLGARRV